MNNLTQCETKSGETCGKRSRGLAAAWAIIGAAGGLAFVIGIGAGISDANASSEAGLSAVSDEPTPVPSDPQEALVNAKRAGDKISLDLTFRDSDNKEHRLGDLVEDGPAVVIFYRGGWCGYCTGSLRNFDSQAQAFEDAGAKVFAVTPETVNHLAPTIEKHGFDDVTLLSDEGLVAGRAFGVAYRNASYKHLSKYNGNDRLEIPLGVTYVINTDGTIAWAWLDDDYRKRADPKDVVEAVKKAKK